MKFFESWWFNILFAAYVLRVSYTGMVHFAEEKTGGGRVVLFLMNFAMAITAGAWGGVILFRFLGVLP